MPDVKVITSFSVPGSSPHGLAWDGKFLWNTDTNSDQLYKLSPQTGEVLGEFPTPGTRSHGIAWEGQGQSLWSADTDDRVISQIDPQSGKVLYSFECPGEPYGLTWDEENLWYGDDKAKTICRVTLSYLSK